MTDPASGSQPRLQDAAMYGSIFLFTASEAALHLLLPPFLSIDLRLEPASIGLVLGTFALASLLVRVPTGAAYRPSRAPLMVVAGGVLATGAYTLVPFVMWAPLMAPLLALDGIGYSIATTALLAGLADSHERGRSTATSMGWYLGFIGLGNAAAGVGGILGDAFGVRWTFLVLAALPMIATVLAAVALRRSRGAGAPVADAGPVGGAESRGMREFAQLLRAPRQVWAAALVMMYINAMNGMINAFHPVLGLANGLSLSQVGVLSSIRSLASSWVRLGSGLLFRFIRVGGLTTPLLLLGTMSAVMIPFVAGSFWLQVPLFVALGLSRGLLRVTGSVLAFDARRGDDRAAGMTSAIIQSGLDVGKLAGPVIAGLIAQFAGVPATFVILPVALAAAYLIIQITIPAIRHGARID